MHYLLEVKFTTSDNLQKKKKVNPWAPSSQSFIINLTLYCGHEMIPSSKAAQSLALVLGWNWVHFIQNLLCRSSVTTSCWQNVAYRLGTVFHYGTEAIPQPHSIKLDSSLHSNASCEIIKHFSTQLVELVFLLPHHCFAFPVFCHFYIYTYMHTYYRWSATRKGESSLSGILSVLALRGLLCLTDLFPSITALLIEFRQNTQDFFLRVWQPSNTFIYLVLLFLEREGKRRSTTWSSPTFLSVRAENGVSIYEAVPTAALGSHPQLLLAPETTPWDAGEASSFLPAVSRKRGWMGVEEDEPSTFPGDSR